MVTVVPINHGVFIRPSNDDLDGGWGIGNLRLYGCRKRS